MATIFGHAVFATALGKLFTTKEHKVPPRFWWLAGLCAILPDIDVIAFSFGIRYGDFFGHRGFTHSIFFAVVVAFIVSRYFFRQSSFSHWKLFWWFFFITMSHGVLDACTDGGLGVAFFSPISNARFFFPIRPIAVSPIGLNFFSHRGTMVLMNETFWIGLLSACLLLLAMIIKRESGKAP